MPPRPACGVCCASGAAGSSIAWTALCKRSMWWAKVVRSSSILAFRTTWKLSMPIRRSSSSSTARRMTHELSPPFVAIRTGAESPMKIAISGIGIAGPALAYWLLRDGHAVTLVEKAPAFRSGGYIIDFWGLGYDLAERMGILAQVLASGYHVRRVQLIDARGGQIGGFSTDALRQVTKGRFISL